MNSASDAGPCTSMPIVLPHSQRVRCIIPINSPTKVLLCWWNCAQFFFLQALYEFVLAKTNVCVPFLLYTRVGHNFVSMFDNVIPDEMRSSVLLVEECPEYEDFLDFFSQVCTKHDYEHSTYILMNTRAVLSKMKALTRYDSNECNEPLCSYYLTCRTRLLHMITVI